MVFSIISSHLLAVILFKRKLSSTNDFATLKCNPWKKNDLSLTFEIQSVRNYQNLGDIAATFSQWTGWADSRGLAPGFLPPSVPFPVQLFEHWMLPANPSCIHPLSQSHLPEGLCQGFICRTPRHYLWQTGWVETIIARRVTLLSPLILLIGFNCLQWIFIL